MLLHNSQRTEGLWNFWGCSIALRSTEISYGGLQTCLGVFFNRNDRNF